MGNAGHQEIEIKLAVGSREALDAISAAAGGKPVGTARQVNHFFDTDALDLDGAKHVVRVRDEDGAFFLTLKGPSKEAQGGALTLRSEEEITLDPATASGLINGGSDPLAVMENAPGMDPSRRALLDSIRKACGGRELKRVGCFQNLRTRLPTSIPTSQGAAQVMLEMDCTTFPGGVVECEIEVEVPTTADAPAVEAGLRDLLQRASVSGKPTSSKAKRFFAALRRT